MSPEVINGLFALGGAFVGVLGAWFVAHRMKERQRVAVTVSPLARLVDVGDLVKSDVKIQFKNQPVESLSMGEIAIHNTGSAPIESIEATITSQPETALIDFEIASANFTYDSDSMTITGDDASRAVGINFLNKNDRIVLSYKLAGKRVEPEIIVRKLGVEVVTKKDLITWIPDIYAEVFYSAFAKMPGGKFMMLMDKSFRLYVKAREERKLLDDPKDN